MSNPTKELTEAVKILTAEILRLNILLSTLSERTIKQRELTPAPSAAPPLPTKKISPYKCPECDGEMVERARKSDGAKFYGCRKFPNCEGTRDMTGRITTYNPTRHADGVSRSDEDCPF